MPTSINNCILFPPIHINPDLYYGGIYSQLSYENIYSELNHKRINGQDFLTKPLDIKLDIVTEISNQKSLFIGVVFSHFGHFLLESLGYLQFIDYSSYDKIYYFKVGGDLSDFHFQIFSLFEIDPKKLICINDSIKFQMLDVLPQRYGFNFFHNNNLEVYEDFRRLGRLLVKSRVALKPYDKLYVSKSELKTSPSGTFFCEKLLEEKLEYDGYFIFYPEKYSLADQIFYYQNASFLIFNEGSALHGLQLIENLSDINIAIISRRKNLEEMFSKFLKNLGANFELCSYIIGESSITDYPWESIGIININLLLEHLLNSKFINIESSITFNDYQNHIKNDIYSNANNLSNMIVSYIRRLI